VSTIAAIVLGQLSVERTPDRIVAVRLEDPALEVVDDQAPGAAAEEGEQTRVRTDEALLVLRVDELDELVAAVRERPDEGLDIALSASGRVEEPAHLAVVELELLPRLGLKATGRLPARELRGQRPHEAFEGAVAGRDAVAQRDDLVGRLRLERIGTPGDEFEDLLAVGLELVLEGPLAWRGPYEGPQLLEQHLPFGQRFISGEPTGLPGADVAPDGLAVDAEGAGDVGDGVAGVPSGEDVEDVHNAFRAVSHGCLVSKGAWDSGRTEETKPMASCRKGGESSWPYWGTLAAPGWGILVALTGE